MNCLTTLETRWRKSQLSQSLLAASSFWFRFGNCRRSSAGSCRCCWTVYGLGSKSPTVSLFISDVVPPSRSSLLQSDLEFQVSKTSYIHNASATPPYTSIPRRVLGTLFVIGIQSRNSSQCGRKAHRSSGLPSRVVHFTGALQPLGA
jgi:hypothetical protein